MSLGYILRKWKGDHELKKSQEKINNSRRINQKGHRNQVNESMDSYQ